MPKNVESLSVGVHNAKVYKKAPKKHPFQAMPVNSCQSGSAQELMDPDPRDLRTLEIEDANLAHFRLGVKELKTLRSLALHFQQHV